jgi:hypothetical protein
MVRVEGLEDVDDLVYVLDRVIEAVEPGRLQQAPPHSPKK